MEVAVALEIMFAVSFVVVLLECLNIMKVVEIELASHVQNYALVTQTLFVVVLIEAIGVHRRTLNARNHLAGEDSLRPRWLPFALHEHRV
jgi:uncharacterized membrane protein